MVVVVDSTDEAAPAEEDAGLFELEAAPPAGTFVDTAAAGVVSVTGQTVVDTAMISVVTEPFAGQFGTLGGQDVTV